MYVIKRGFLKSFISSGRGHNFYVAANLIIFFVVKYIVELLVVVVAIKIVESHAPYPM